MSGSDKDRDSQTSWCVSSLFEHLGGGNGGTGRAKNSSVLREAS